MVNSKLPVKDVMVSPVITTTPDETLNNAAKLMLEHGIGGLVVVEEDTPVGIITERDFVGVLARKNKKPGELLVSEIMSRNLVTTTPEEGIFDVAELIVKVKKRKIPVMDNGKLVGIITADDILKVAPDEIKILRELPNIKSEDVQFKEPSTEGKCELCENYSENLVKVNDRYTCEDCREAAE